MRKDAFRKWLTTHLKQKATTAAARASNCATVEGAYGKDLDTLTQDEFARLLDQFEYSKADERANRPVRHKVPINGIQRTGTAMYKSALTLYRHFRFSPDRGGKEAAPDGEPLPKPAPASEWPLWESPSEEDSLLLAKVLARHARFLKPEIVRAIVEDNNQRSAGWRAGLSAHGIPCDAYLWDRSPCAFPGVRRYSGSDEIAIFRGRKLGDGKLPPDALTLDDNDYPKHLWSFLFRGKPFQKHGPKGYNLAHLADHKNHNNRAGEDFGLEPGADVDRRLHGLFTCPTNTVFLPAGLLKPTDFHAKVRGLFIRKAQRLYGECCGIVPPFMTARENDDPRWDVDSFEWADPVGELTHMALFLEFRAQRIERLLALSVPDEPKAIGA